jgi:flagellar basal-body rod protein FlgG
MGMIVQSQKMDVIADNIANVNTTGHKRDATAARSFSDELMRRLDDLDYEVLVGPSSHGVYMDEVHTDFSGGGLHKTGAPLDLAISGGGFFTVSVNGTEMYTRDGSFTLSADGTLITKDGAAVLGTGGPIQLPLGVISVYPDGRVYVNGVYADTLQMTDFTDRRALRKAQDNLYALAPSAGDSAVPFQGEIHPGFLEASNVSAVKEMVDMIQASRAYEANQRMIVAHDAAMGRIANDIGKK